MTITDEEVEAFLQALERPAEEWPAPSAGGTNARPILTIMADFGMSPLLWMNTNGDDDGGVGGCCCDSFGRCGGHPMSDVLFDAFNEWIAEFEAAPWTAGSFVNPDDAESGYLAHPQMILNWPDFHLRGLELAKRLKDEVGSAFRVVYEKPIEDPARHEDERHEVLDDGSVVLLPPRRSPRASAAGCED